MEIKPHVKCQVLRGPRIHLQFFSSLLFILLPPLGRLPSHVINTCPDLQDVCAIAYLPEAM